MSSSSRAGHHSCLVTHGCAAGYPFAAPHRRVQSGLHLRWASPLPCSRCAGAWPTSSQGRRLGSRARGTGRRSRSGMAQHILGGSDTRLLPSVRPWRDRGPLGSSSDLRSSEIPPYFPCTRKFARTSTRRTEAAQVSSRRCQVCCLRGVRKSVGFWFAGPRPCDRYVVRTQQKISDTGRIVCACQRAFHRPGWVSVLQRIHEATRPIRASQGAKVHPSEGRSDSTRRPNSHWGLIRRAPHFFCIHSSPEAAGNSVSRRLTVLRPRQDFPARRKASLRRQSAAGTAAQARPRTVVRRYPQDGPQRRCDVRDSTDSLQRTKSSRCARVHRWVSFFALFLSRS